MESRIRVGVLGATGAVGQRLLAHLVDHPWFDLVRVTASARSQGRPYRDACEWRLPTALPERFGDLVIRSADPDPDVQLVFSGLGADVAGPIEEAWAESGAWVFSNAKSHRMEADVPLMIPEVNPGHLELVHRQRALRGWQGAIVTNANCSTTFLAMALAPLHRRFGVEAVTVATLQAVSGAGYAGVSSMSILGNVVPHIPGEEDKIQTEAGKILGTCDGQRVEPARLAISAQVHRVPVLDGHLEAVSVRLGTRAELPEVLEAIQTFTGEPQRLRLPSAPSRPLVYIDGEDRPQPGIDLYREKAMATLVGRLRPCPVLDYRMVLLGHNTVRGAGPGSVLNAEYALATDWIEARP